MMPRLPPVEIVLRDVSSNLDPSVPHTSLLTRTIRLADSNNWSVKVGRASSSASGGEEAQMADNARFGSKVVSRNHATISAAPEDKRVFVTDDGSMHGTHLHGRRLPEQIAHPVENGDVITFGASVDRNGTKYEPVQVKFHATWPDAQRGFWSPPPHTASDDPLLDKVYGARPVRPESWSNYSEDDEDSDGYSEDDPNISHTSSQDPSRRFTVPESDQSDDSRSVIDGEGYSPEYPGESPHSSPIPLPSSDEGEITKQERKNAPADIIMSSASAFSGPTQVPAQLRVASHVEGHARIPNPPLENEDEDDNAISSVDDLSDDPDADEQDEDSDDDFDDVSESEQDEYVDQSEVYENEHDPEEPIQRAAASMMGPPWAPQLEAQNDRVAQFRDPSPSDAAMAKPSLVTSIPPYRDVSSMYLGNLGVPSYTSPPSFWQPPRPMALHMPPAPPLPQPPFSAMKDTFPDIMPSARTGHRTDVFDDFGSRYMRGPDFSGEVDRRYTPSTKLERYGSPELPGAFSSPSRSPVPSRSERSANFTTSEQLCLNSDAPLNVRKRSSFVFDDTPPPEMLHGDHAGAVSESSPNSRKRKAQVLFEEDESQPGRDVMPELVSGSDDFEGFPESEAANGREGENDAPTIAQQTVMYETSEPESGPAESDEARLATMMAVDPGSGSETEGRPHKRQKLAQVSTQLRGESRLWKLAKYGVAAAAGATFGAAAGAVGAVYTLANLPPNYFGVD